MKNYEEVIGIDVSKKTLDVYCHHTQVHKVFNNDLSLFPVPQGKMCGMLQRLPLVFLKLCDTYF
jgi:hypothetical protein